MSPRLLLHLGSVFFIALASCAPVDSAGDQERASDAAGMSDAREQEDAAAASHSDGAIAWDVDAGADTDAAERPSDPDAATHADACTRSSLPLSTQCSRDSDCTFAFRDGCCGGTYYGFAASSADADRMNRACVEPLMCGALGCANISRAEDQQAAYSAGAVRVACVQNQCRTWVPSATFACGIQACSAEQYCEWLGSGTSNTWASQICRALPPGCTSCSCLASSQSGCSCIVMAGHFEVRCQAP